MNICSLIGNLTRDVEKKTTSTGQSVVKFTLAVDRIVKKSAGKQTDFIRVVAFDSLADLCARCLVKGSRVGVVGRIMTSSYADDEGRRIYMTEVMVDKIDFLSSMRNDSGESAGADADPKPANDDEIPF